MEIMLCVNWQSRCDTIECVPTKRRFAAEGIPPGGTKGKATGMNVKIPRFHFANAAIAASIGVALTLATPIPAAANNCYTVVSNEGIADSTGTTLHTGWYGQNIGNEFTVGLWAKGFRAKWWHYLFEWKGANLHIENNKSDLNFVVVQADAGNGGAATSVTVTKANWRSSLRGDQWHYYCCTFKYDPETPANSFQRLYIDGELEAEATGSAIVGPPITPASNKHFAIGGKWNTGNYAEWRAQAGFLSEVTVWSRALSASEVAAFNGRRAGGSENGLLLYWPLTANLANASSSGISATLSQNYSGSPRWSVTQDDDFPLSNNRCVASAEWVAEHGYVPPVGATFRSWDAPATNIADAVSAAKAGETILIMPGTHLLSSQIDITKANLSFVRGDGEGEAVIDAQGLCRHFRCSSDYSGESNFTFDGLTFVNGSATAGGALYFKSKVGTIRNCVFRNNSATSDSGGAIHSYTASGTVISNCVFAGNSSSSYGGAIYTEQNANAADNRCFLINSVVTNNTAKKGGGVFAGKNIAISGCFFKDNAATAGGTAADNRGGNLRLGNYSTVADTTFTGKCTTPGNGYGSCIETGSSATPITVTNCMFTGLSSGNTYGLLYVNGGACTLVDCVFSNNTGVSAHLLFNSGGGTYLVRQCLFAADAGSSGISVVNDRASKRFENCTILNKFSTKGSWSAKNVLVNCIVPNSAITSNDSVKNILTNCCVKVGAIPDGSQDFGVIAANPRFVDAAHGDYALRHGSPCRDTALMLGWMTADATDLAGNPRVVTEGVPLAADSAALPDMGCFECLLKQYPTMLYVR